MRLPSLQNFRICKANAAIIIIEITEKEIKPRTNNVVSAMSKTINKTIVISQVRINFLS
jgi:hypothetical protein